MKMKYLIGTLAFLAIGTGIYYLVKKSSNNEGNSESDAKEYVDSKQTEPHMSTVIQNELDSEIHSFEESKSTSYTTIINRHQETAKEMEKSLKNIIDETSVDEVISDNEEDFTDMDDALDKLLDE